MKTAINVLILVLLLPISPSAQRDESWPSLSYLRNDYRSVSVVAHVLIREAQITGRVGGYENWRITSEILEPFKGKFRKGHVIEYFQGAEAGLKKEYFKGEKIIFLLSERDAPKKALRYSVLENSTLPYTADCVRKLRTIKGRMQRSDRCGERTLTGVSRRPPPAILQSSTPRAPAYPVKSVGRIGYE